MNAQLSRHVRHTAHAILDAIERRQLELATEMLACCSWHYTPPDPTMHPGGKCVHFFGARSGAADSADRSGRIEPSSTGAKSNCLLGCARRVLAAMNDSPTPLHRPH